MKKYSAGMSRIGAHLRLPLEELPAVMACDVRLYVGGLTVLRDFLEINVVQCGKVVLPVVNVEAVVVGKVAVELVEIVDVKVDTADREEVFAEVDTMDHEVVADIDTADREEVVAEVDTADRKDNSCRDRHSGS